MHPFQIPVEIWEEIFYMVEKPELLSLSTTCHLFYPLAQAELYQTVSFARPSRQDGDDLSTLQFARTLEAHPDLFSLVHSLSLNSRYGYSISDRYWDDFMLHPLLRQLTSFSHLQTLRLETFVVDADCITAIRTLRHLKRFEASGCRIVSPFSSSFPHGALRIIVPELKIEFVEHDDLGTLASSGTQSLVVNDAYYLDLKMKSFVLHGVHDTLTKFVWDCRTHELEIEHIIPLCNFLEHCTQLQSLAIRLSSTRKIPLELSSEALPLLTEFKVPADYAQLLLKNRPVCNVAVYFFPDTPTHIFSALDLSSVPLSSLEIGFNSSKLFIWTEEFELMMKHLPSSLRRIHLNGFLFREHHVSQWLAVLSKAPLLHSVKITGRFEISQQEILVRQFSTACQSLRVIEFINVYHDVKWRWRDGCNWEIYRTM